MKKSLYKTIYLIISVFIATLMPSCDDNPDAPVHKAVIEGYIRNGEYPTVFFSSSVIPEISGNVADAVINWGKVTLTDGDTTVVLTGRVDDSSVPPFVYYTFDMVGTPGKTYSVLAKFKNLKAHASVKMPDQVKIDSIIMTPTEYDSLRSVTLHFTSPKETPSFFYLSIKKRERGARMLPCMMGTIRTDVPEAHYSIRVLRPRVRIDSANYVPQLIVGEEWIVSLNRTESPVYDFWKAYDDMVMFSSSPFITSSQSLPTNISGGFGVWSVEASTQSLITVQ